MAATMTVRLSPDDAAILDRAAERYGSRSAAIRAALRFLDDDRKRREAMAEFLDLWEDEVGPIDPAEVQRMREAYGEP
ncbi:MAG TPA: ribbon-helix-helix domain-containing protein [Iamia sp.]|nr:ribbon-helix-helix domain-containing protein [Iamia sp.]